MSSSNDPQFQVTLSVPWLIFGMLGGLPLIFMSLSMDRNLCDFGTRIIFCTGMGLLLSGFFGKKSRNWEWFIGRAVGIALIVLGFFLIFPVFNLQKGCSSNNLPEQLASRDSIPSPAPAPPSSTPLESTPSATQQPVGIPLSESSPSPLPESVPRAPLELAPSTSPEREPSVSPSGTIPSSESLPGVLPQSVTSSLPESSQRPPLKSSPNPPREEESSRPQPQVPSPEPEKGTDAGPPAIPSEPQKAETSAPPASVQSLCPSPAKATPEGWVYVGTNLGRHWDVKHFNWDSYNKRLPERDDVLTATGLVNLRKRFGKHAPIVGVICPDEQVQVLESKTLSNSYHWVRIKRTQKEQDSL